MPLTNKHVSLFSQYEPIYGTPYQETNLSTALVHYWQNEGEFGDLHLPGPNEFIPEDLEVLEPPVNASNTPVEVPIDGKHKIGNTLECCSYFAG